ncbi:hypothetical protein B194_2296 [Serratia plymuthica A30]|nr:hypothetical protein B194_2296 [Serratia plymuthica A30]
MGQASGDFLLELKYLPRFIWQQANVGAACCAPTRRLAEV